MKLTCDNVEEWISQSLDGELAEEHEAMLNEHLAQCETCQSRRKAWSLQTQLLQAAADEGRPTAEAMWKDVQHEVQRLNEQQNASKIIQFQRRLFAVAALALLAAGLYLVGRFVIPPSDVAKNPDPDLAEMAQAEVSLETPIEDAITMNWVDEETGIVVFWVDEPGNEEIF